MEDFAIYHPAARRTVATAIAWREGRRSVGTQQERARAIASLCAAARLQTDAGALRDLQRRIDGHMSRLDVDAVDWSEWVPNFQQRHLRKAALLKPYLSRSEKGVLFISFETEWFKLLAASNRAELAARFDIVLASTGDPHNLLNHVFASVWPSPVYCLLSNPKDGSKLPTISKNIEVIDLYASSWVNPEWYRPVSRKDRQYDLIMVANFAKFKRHFSLFSTVRSLPADTRILLIGQDAGKRSAPSIREEASWYGIGERITMLQNLPHSAVMAALAQSRASVILSYREGSCVVVAESMLCDTPVALLDGCEVGSSAFINDQTGRFLSHRRLGVELAEFVRQSDNYSPRAWALENISSPISSAELNARLRQDSIASGRRWTVDIAPLQWDPNPTVADPTTRAALEPERRAFEERYGLRCGWPMPDLAAPERLQVR